MSGAQKVIIDGYNVIYTDDTLRRIACKDLERSRKELIKRLRAYLADKNLRVTLVFDGRGGVTDSEALIPGKLQVLFSSAGTSADELIVRTVTDSGNPRQFLVVTSDRADIGSRLGPLGCDIMGSKRFLERIAQQRPSGPEARRPEADLGDTDYWLRKFGDGDKEDT